MRNSPLQWSIPSMYNIDFEIWAFRNYTELTRASPTFTVVPQKQVL